MLLGTFVFIRSQSGLARMGARLSLVAGACRWFPQEGRHSFSRDAGVREGLEASERSWETPAKTTATRRSLQGPRRGPAGAPCPAIAEAMNSNNLLGLTWTS